MRGAKVQLAVNMMLGARCKGTVSGQLDARCQVLRYSDRST